MQTPNETPVVGLVRRVIFSPETLVALMQHYSEDLEDRIPLDATLVGMGPTRLERLIVLFMESASWEGGVTFGREGKIGLRTPLHFRYEGRKVLSWGGRDQNLAWQRTENKFE